MFCAFAVTLLLASAVYSWLYEQEVVTHLFYIRLSGVAILTVIYRLLGTRAGARRPRQLALVALLALTLTMIGLAQWTGGQLSPQYDRIAAVILAAAVLMTWSAAWALLACAGVVGACAAAAVASGELGSAPFVGNAVRMLGASAVTVAVGVARERRRWQSVRKVHALHEARQRAADENRRLNRELEARVLARTAELRASEARARANFEAARAHQAHLAHVLRVTTMGGMAAELAHELNQPLGAIVNFANGAVTRLRRGGADPAIVDAVAGIADEGMRAAEILRRVREFVRPGGVVRQAVDLNAVVREALLLTEVDLRRAAVPVALGLAADLPLVAADRIQVEQVVLNLLRNAVEAMAAGNGAPHELVVETRLQGSEEAAVLVRDTGPGVAATDAEQIFEAFHTTKPGGLGMGLAISRSIVEAYGGRLWAQANPQRGMTFGFSLPVNAADAGDEAGAGLDGGDDGSPRAAGAAKKDGHRP